MTKTVFISSAYNYILQWLLTNNNNNNKKYFSKSNKTKKQTKLLELKTKTENVKKANSKYYSCLGLGTDLGTFKGTYRFASVLPSIDSH